MELAQLLNDNWSLIAALVMGGLLMGFFAGLLGLGGGAMLVPILYEGLSAHRRSRSPVSAFVYWHVAAGYGANIVALFSGSQKTEIC